MMLAQAHRVLLLFLATLLKLVAESVLGREAGISYVRLDW